MKKIILFITFAFFAITTNAQFEDGSVSAGPTLSIGHSITDVNSLKTINGGMIGGMVKLRFAGIFSVRADYARGRFSEMGNEAHYSAKYSQLLGSVGIQTPADWTIGYSDWGWWLEANANIGRLGTNHKTHLGRKKMSGNVRGLAIGGGVNIPMGSNLCADVIVEYLITGSSEESLMDNLSGGRHIRFIGKDAIESLRITFALRIAEW